MVKVYPPHQDKGGTHYRLVDDSALASWLGRGWTLDYLVSIGEKTAEVDNGMRKEKADQDEAEIIAGAIEVSEPAPRKRGRPAVKIRG